MSDILIRDVPEDVILAIDSRAAGLRLSRNEYLRRRLRQDARSAASPIAVADLERLAIAAGDLADPGVMAQAWS